MVYAMYGHANQQNFGTPFFYRAFLNFKHVARSLFDLLSPLYLSLVCIETAALQSLQEGITMRLMKGHQYSNPIGN